MKNLYKYIFLVPILMVLMACPENYIWESFTFYNNSTFDVYYYLGVAPKEIGGSLYPDTTLMLLNGADGPLEKGEHASYIAKKSPHTDTLSLFIFDADVIDQYSWDIIKEEYKILKRYDLSSQDFKRLKYIITYPPTEEMKDVKMYPPYKEEE
jgi:hypothetical protein